MHATRHGCQRAGMTVAGRTKGTAASGLEASLDSICTRIGRMHGQLVTALVLRKVSPAMLVEQVEQVEQVLLEYRKLLSTLGKGN
jgi:hypothetical protein